MITSKMIEAAPILPSYSDPGRILVNVIGEGKEREFEVLDYEEDSGVFWINEGVGFDWWLEHYGPEYPTPGLYVIENIKGEYTRGGWTTDDNEDWEYDQPRQPTLRERMSETLDPRKPFCPTAE